MPLSKRENDLKNKDLPIFIFNEPKDREIRLWFFSRIRLYIELATNRDNIKTKNYFEPSKYRYIQNWLCFSDVDLRFRRYN